MYSVAVRRSFIARHFLVGGDWGAECELHSHHYQVEVELQGESLDTHGYLVDIVEIEAALEELMARYRDRTLNELPEFEGQNPSLERFARYFHQALAEKVQASNVATLTVTLWENDQAWASYRQEC